MAGQGQIYSFSDTVTTKRTIANVVHIIDPRDVPCVSFFGTKNQNKFKMVDFPNHKYAWLKDTLRVREATVNDSGGVDTTTTSIGVASSHGLRFKPGDVWLTAEGEVLWIDSISNDTLTVIRNWGNGLGTGQGTGTSIADSGTLRYLYSARLEGDDSDASHWTTPTELYNYSQIFHAELKVSGSEQDATTRYGIPDTYKYQIAKLLGGAGAGNGKQGRAGDLMIDLENTFFYGQAVQRSSSAAGSMAGADALITTNRENLNGDTLEQKVLEDVVQACWAAGGNPNTIICNAFNKRLISSWFKDSIRTERTERTGGVVVNNIETEFGIFDIMMNRRCPADRIYVMDRDGCGWVTLRDWFIHPLPAAGDYKKDEILGEFGFVLVNEEANAVIYNTATS